MKNLDFLTGKLGLKIIAFVLAVVLYLVVKQGSATNGFNNSSNQNDRNITHQAN
jgi:YbbR domain-containing protein